MALLALWTWTSFLATRQSSLATVVLNRKESNRRETPVFNTPGQSPGEPDEGSPGDWLAPSIFFSFQSSCKEKQNDPFMPCPPSLRHNLLCRGERFMPQVGSIGFMRY